MTPLGLVRPPGRPAQHGHMYTIEYTSSEHRGIIMYSETHEATNPAGALAYAKTQLPDVALKYGARGYRVKDVEGVFHKSEETAPL